MKIQVKQRKVTGKKNKILRRKGIVPGVVYGPKRKSLNVELELKEFKKIFSQAGYSKLIDLEVKEEKKENKVLIREVQYEPITDSIDHVSFYELDLAKHITANIPLEVTGESKAVKESIGFLVTPLDSIEVRCLPSDLPEKFTLNISSLQKIGDSITTADLKVPRGVSLTKEVAQNATLAYIAPPQKEIVEEEKVEAEEVEGEEKKVVEGEEGEEVAEEGEETLEKEGALKGEKETKDNKEVSAKIKGKK